MSERYVVAPNPALVEGQARAAVCRCEPPPAPWRYDDGTPSARPDTAGAVWRCRCGQHWYSNGQWWRRRSERWVRRYKVKADTITWEAKISELTARDPGLPELPPPPPPNRPVYEKASRR